jgi:hypothetical protein
LRGHACDACRLNAPVGPDAINQRQASTDLVLRDLKHAFLLLEGAGGDFGRMSIDRDGGKAFGRSHLA